MLSHDWSELAVFWRIDSGFDIERRKVGSLESLKEETPSARASILAGLAVGMLAMGELNAALVSAARALNLGPEAHGPYCCSAAEVLFSPKLLIAAAEVTLDATVRGRPKNRKRVT